MIWRKPAKLLNTEQKGSWDPAVPSAILPDHPASAPPGPAPSIQHRGCHPAPPRGRHTHLPAPRTGCTATLRGERERSITYGLRHPHTLSSDREPLRRRGLGPGKPPREERRHSQSQRERANADVSHLPNQRSLCRMRRTRHRHCHACMWLDSQITVLKSDQSILSLKKKFLNIFY